LDQSRTRSSSTARTRGRWQGIYLSRLLRHNNHASWLDEGDGSISFPKKTPEQVADLIVKKLVAAGVELPRTLPYSDNAKADIDFPTPKANAFTKLLTDLKSHD